jgi:hypothetical protein
VRLQHVIHAYQDVAEVVVLAVVVVVAAAAVEEAVVRHAAGVVHHAAGVVRHAAAEVRHAVVQAHHTMEHAVVVAADAAVGVMVRHAAAAVAAACASVADPAACDVQVVVLQDHLQLHFPPWAFDAVVAAAAAAAVAGNWEAVGVPDFALTGVPHAAVTEAAVDAAARVTIADREDPALALIAAAALIWEALQLVAYRSTASFPLAASFGIAAAAVDEARSLAVPSYPCSYAGAAPA